MVILKKISLSFIFVIILVGFMSFSLVAGKFQSGLIEQNIINPLQMVIDSQQSSLKSSSQSNFQTKLESKYSKFDDYGRNWDPTNSYTCIVGGNYLINILSKPKNSGFFNQTSNLFYCRTTQDLINKIKIPSSWSKNNLVLYCNDGKAINSKSHSFDFITSKLNTYKTCILKNLDTQNTILFGFDAGNKAVDSLEQLYFNDTKKSGSIINSNLIYQNKDGDNYIFKDKKNDNLKYYFKYDFVNSFYSLSDTNLNLDFSIKNIFYRDIGISRIALFKHFSNLNNNSNGNNIFGYETALSLEKSISTNIILPVYKIIYGNSISLSSTQCSNFLQKYEAKQNGNLLFNDKVVCTGIGSDRKILINSYQIDRNNYGTSKVDSFNLFKNIILGLNN